MLRAAAADGLATVPARGRDQAGLGQPADPLRPGDRHPADGPGAGARRGRPGGPRAGRRRPGPARPPCWPRPASSSRSIPRRGQLATGHGQATGTVGGMLATGAAGPRRLRYGTPRDLLIGITVVRADGTVAYSGGKVVKNVAGYDLGKLFAGLVRDARADRRGRVPAAPAARRDRVRHRGRRGRGRGARGAVAAAAGSAAGAVRGRDRPAGPRRAGPGRRCCWRAIPDGRGRAGRADARRCSAAGSRDRSDAAPPWWCGPDPGAAAAREGSTLIRIGVLGGGAGPGARRGRRRGGRRPGWTRPSAARPRAGVLLRRGAAASAEPAAVAGFAGRRCGTRLARGLVTGRARGAGQRGLARPRASAVVRPGPGRRAGPDRHVGPGALARPDAGGEGPVRPGAPDGAGPVRRRDLRRGRGIR